MNLKMRQRLPYYSLFLLLPLSVFLKCDGLFSDKEKAPNPSYVFPEEITCGGYDSSLCVGEIEDEILAVGGRLEARLLELLEIDQSMEVEIGDQFHQESGFSFVEDRRTQKLRSLLQQIISKVKRRDLNYQIFLIEESEINAWTVPGGRIYFTTAAFDFVESDDELITLISHEIGHHECKHTHKQLQRRAAANLPLSFLGVDADASYFADLYSQVFISFNQYQELEADRTGLYLTTQTGHDPVEGLQFWKRLAKYEQEQRWQKFLRSHPYSSQRYDCGMTFLAQHKVDD